MRKKKVVLRERQKPFRSSNCHVVSPDCGGSCIFSCTYSRCCTVYTSRSLLHSTFPTSRDETQVVKGLTKSFQMHSIFFGLRQYCSACHQALFTKNVFQSTEKTISARSQNEWKATDKSLFSLFSGKLNAMKNHLVFHLWTDFHIHGHLREVRLLWPTSSQGEGWMVTGTQAQAQTSTLSSSRATHYAQWQNDAVIKQK